MSSRTITNAASLLLPPNRLRKSWIVQNEDATIDVFIKAETGTALTVSTTDHDHRVSGGGNFAVNDLTDGKEAILGRWTIIAASGTPRISVFETEDIRR